MNNEWFSEDVKELRQRIRTSPKDEYARLDRTANEAWWRTEETTANELDRRADPRNRSNGCAHRIAKTGCAASSGAGDGNRTHTDCVSGA